MKQVVAVTFSITLVLVAVVMSIDVQAAKERKMVITVLEAQVAHDRVSDLERAYREATSQIPPDIVETFLVRDAADATVFRIMTVWVSREALEKMRVSGAKPKGVQIFEAAGATPKLLVLDVVVHRTKVGEK